MLCVRVTMLSQNQAPYDYFLVEKSLAAFVIFRESYQESPYAIQMCCWRCAWKCICFGRNDCRNLQFCCPVHSISFREVVGRLPPSWLCEFVKPHLLLPKSVQAVLYWFRDFAHHPAGFVIFAQLAQLCIFIIFLMISVLMLVGSSKIAQTVPDTSQHLFKWFF